MTKTKYISRLDSPSAIGWWFRLCLHGRKVTHSKFFSDNRNGGTTKAYNKAIRYRNKLLRELGIEERLLKRMRKPENHTSNLKNSSGVIGVTLGKTCKKDNIFYDWRAYWSKNGKQKVKSFSIIKHGDCKAFKLACQTRFEKAGTLYIYKNSVLPCRVPFGLYKFIADTDKSHKS